MSETRLIYFLLKDTWGFAYMVWWCAILETVGSGFEDSDSDSRSISRKVLSAQFLNCNAYETLSEE